LAAPAPLDDFARDFLTDLMPYAESHYRVLTARANRAIAGLSMGGSQTLNVAFLHLEKFAYIGVFSSGASLGRGGRAAAAAAPGAAATPARAAAPAGPTHGNLHGKSPKRLAQGHEVDLVQYWRERWSDPNRSRPSRC
jgi:enterochelin esterase family protein